jgi:hypothetical protein
MVDDNGVSDPPDDEEGYFTEEGNGDEVLESAFPTRRGRVDVLSWRVTEEIEYRLFFGRLERRVGVATWGLLTVNRGAVVGKAIYEDRPREFTRDGLIAWLMASGVDAGAAWQLTDLAVVARGDLFPDEPAEEDDPEGEPSTGV